ncbi:hypothetical protein G4B84_011248 [Aspergillus flavus NRRL3357]|nr:uncharacterized protein G4B84_011248 [Aspergillus flavus NRRL3357]QMW35719.1 hypothetical protein G4B84_011248 [Aspergillus flavus NRRL3357]QMW47781.1 hypothetical protein G4B11_011299 [Aspergillus flavus]
MASPRSSTHEDGENERSRMDHQINPLVQIDHDGHLYAPDRPLVSDTSVASLADDYSHRSTDDPAFGIRSTLEGLQDFPVSHKSKDVESGCTGNCGEGYIIALCPRGESECSQPCKDACADASQNMLRPRLQQ